MDIAEASRLLNRCKRRGPGNCQECGAPFYGVVTRKWCGNRCAMRGWRRKHKEQADNITAQGQSLDSAK